MLLALALVTTLSRTKRGFESRWHHSPFSVRRSGHHEPQLVGKPRVQAGRSRTGLVAADETQVQLARPHQAFDAFGVAEPQGELDARVLLAECPEQSGQHVNTRRGAGADREGPRSSPCRSWIAWRASARVTKSRVTCSASTRPASVGATRRASRSKRRAPSAVSSSRTCWESAGWLRCSVSAARWKLPARVIARKTSNCRSVISGFPYGVDLNFRLELIPPSAREWRACGARLTVDR
jgi:hypothetical protein